LVLLAFGAASKFKVFAKTGKISTTWVKKRKLSELPVKRRRR